MDIEMLGLPCARGRHPSCSGIFFLGVARQQRRYGCLCPCHHAENERRAREYATRLSQPRLQLLPS